MNQNNNDDKIAMNQEKAYDKDDANNCESLYHTFKY